MSKNGSKRQGKLKHKKDEGYLRESKLNTGWNLNWYKPEGRQRDILDCIDNCDLTIVNAPSGTGKSSTVIFKALQEYRSRNFQKVYLIKTPSEAGDDMLGYLKGGKEDKLASHMQSMKGLFLQFMDKAKLEMDIKNENIIMDVPNYLLGATLNHSLIILEEAQTMSPETIKLCCERAGEGSKVVIVGDSRQRYSAKKRDDGLQDLINKVTFQGHGTRFSNYENVGYVEMDSSDNKRSDLSRFIIELYSGEANVSEIQKRA